MLQEYEKLSTERVDNAYLLQKKIDEVEKMLGSLPDSGPKQILDGWLVEARSDAADAKDAFRFQFGQQLKALFEQDGVKVRGQYPLLRMGMFTLRMNFDFGDATLFFGPEVEKLRSKIPLQPRTIYDIIKQYDSGMKSGLADLNKIYEDLSGAYQRCLKVSGKSPGHKVLISDVLREYVFSRQSKQFGIDARRENFHEYPRINLSYMLYGLRTNRIAGDVMRLHVATFDATVDKVRSFWVPDNEEGDGTHYEYISFEEPHE